MVRRSLVTLQFAIMIGLGSPRLTIWRQTLFSLDNQLRVDGSSILLIDDACDPSGRAFQDRVATLPGSPRPLAPTRPALHNGGMIRFLHGFRAGLTFHGERRCDYNALKFWPTAAGGAILRIVTTVMMAPRRRRYDGGIRRLSSTKRQCGNWGLRLQPRGWPDCDLESPALECKIQTPALGPSETLVYRRISAWTPVEVCSADTLRRPHLFSVRRSADGIANTRRL